MGKIPQALENNLKQFQADVKALFGQDLVSVTVYGSAVTADYVPKKSDMNVLVVLTESGIGNLLPVQSYIRKWQKKKISNPLFLTESYIEESLDSFPIEFLNMQSDYVVLSGKDVLAGLAIDNKDLRLQCERELKGNLLHLRQGFIETQGKAKNLQMLIAESIVAFVSVFRGLLRLKQVEPASLKQDIIQQTCTEFKLNLQLFSTMFALRRGEKKMSKEDLEETVKQYIESIQLLSKTVDRM